MKPEHMVLMLAAGLGACGGSSSGPELRFTSGDDPSPAQGLYHGNTTNQPGQQSLTGVVLDTGEYYFLYSPQGGSLLNDGVAGVINGTSTAESGDFGSTDARDYVIGGQVYNAEISATYTAGQNLTGMVIHNQDPPGSVGFTTTYDSAYEREPDLDAAVATYEGYLATRAGQRSATLEIAADGNITGHSDANEPICTFEGSAAERDRGNILNITLSFEDNVDCAPNNRGETLAGIAYHDAGNDALILAATSADRSAGAFFAGQPPTN